jgi:hypothetical protein
MSNLRIPDQKPPSGPLTLPDKAPKPNLHISLKYWHAGSECLSAWQRNELKKFRKLVDIVQATNREGLVGGGTQLKPHKGTTGSGFARPAALSKDLTMYELRVDQTARVHGVFQNDIFFLVWLDRRHAVFPSGK